MGDPTPDPDDRLGCKCVFNEPGCWTKSADWVFVDEVAVFGPLIGGESHVLSCPLQMVVGQFYTAHFELFDADFRGFDALVLRISAFPASHSLEIRTNGEYHITLEYKQALYPLELFVESPFNDPTSFKLKLFISELAASTAAYSEALYPFTGTKNEVISPSQSEACILLAHWRDKTNVLIKKEY